jgi:hypothetical protein
MFRKIIIAEMKRQGVTTAQLARRLTGKVSKQRLYPFLAGKKDVVSGGVESICKELGLTLTPARRPRTIRQK